MVGRKAPEDAELRLARLGATVDWALAEINEVLRTHSGNKQLCDSLLDIRNILVPPPKGGQQ